MPKKCSRRKNQIKNFKLIWIPCTGLCKRSTNERTVLNIFCLFYIFNHSATLFYKVQVYKPAKCCLSYLVKNFVLAIYIAASSSWRTDVHPSGQGSVERKERFYPRYYYYYSTIARYYTKVLLASLWVSEQLPSAQSCSQQYWSPDDSSSSIDRGFAGLILAFPLLCDIPPKPWRVWR